MVKNDQPSPQQLLKENTVTDVRSPPPTKEPMIDVQRSSRWAIN